MCQSHVVADHKCIQINGFDPQHGGAMTSMHKGYSLGHPPKKKLVKFLQILIVSDETIHKAFRIHKTL